MSDDERTMWVICASCGHKNRKHRVLYEKVQEHPDQDGSLLLDECHYLVECMGCERIKYVNRVHFHDPEIDDSVSVYPDAPGATRQRAAMVSYELDRNRKPLIPYEPKCQLDRVASHTKLSIIF